MVGMGRVCVVIPAYNAAGTIGAVIRSVPADVEYIIVVDDGSPDRTAEAARAVGDERVTVVRHAANQGVGGAMRIGFAQALQTEADVICKMDADGQMEAALLPDLTAPLLEDSFDYAKGNRWYDLASLRQMPLARRLGNAALSFLTKAASGYWGVYDPQNGYVAIRREALERLDLDALDRGYFFENSMLVQLNIIGARVAEVPMPARYGGERSAMCLSRIVLGFPWKLLRAGLMRLRLKYFGMDFSPVAVLLIVGGSLFAAGACYGAYEWTVHALRHQATPAGTVMLAALPTLLGSQFLLNALLLDIGQSPPGNGIRRIASRSRGSDPARSGDAVRGKRR
jgi:dolichol-phosphate mannosyltransferase